MNGIATLVRVSLLAAAAGAVSVCAGAAFAQTPLKIVVGISAGGTADLSARILATRLSALLKRPAIVENKPGASMMIATRLVATSPADGNTLLFATAGPMVVNPMVYPDEPIDPLKHLTPIGMILTAPLILTVNKSFPAGSAAEFIAYAKANPGKVNYSVGTSTFRIAAEMLVQQTGVRLTPVPYSGAAPAARAVMSGEVQATVLDLGSVISGIKSGMLRPLVVSARKRIKELPDVPAAPEVGLDSFEMETWGAFFAPRGLLPAIEAQLVEGVATAMQSADVRERIAALSFEPVYVGPVELAARIANDRETFARVIKQANIPLK